MGLNVLESVPLRKLPKRLTDVIDEILRANENGTQKNIRKFKSTAVKIASTLKADTKQVYSEKVKTFLQMFLERGQISQEEMNILVSKISNILYYQRFNSAFLPLLSILLKYLDYISFFHFNFR